MAARVESKNGFTVKKTVSLQSATSRVAMANGGSIERPIPLITERSLCLAACT